MLGRILGRRPRAERGHPVALPTDAHVAFRWVDAYEFHQTIAVRLPTAMFQHAGTAKPMFDNPPQRD